MNPESDQSNHLQLMNAIASIDKRTAVIETEVKELNRRVGVQNGRVADSEAAIKKIVGEQDRMKGARGAAKYIITLILSLLALALTIYFKI